MSPKRLRCWLWHQPKWKWMGPAHRQLRHDHTKRHTYSCNRCHQTWSVVEWTHQPISPRTQQRRVLRVLPMPWGWQAWKARFAALSF